MRAGRLGAAALLLLTLSGCGRATNPIDDRALVLGVAADAAGKQGINYTMEIPSPQSLSGSSGGNQFYTVSAASHSFDAAISQMENKTSRDIYLGQMHVLVMALDLPSNLRDRMLAEEQRIGETDHTEWLVLADGQAARVLQPPPLQERLPAFFYSTHFDCRGCQAVDYGVPAWRAEADLASPGGTAVLPVARVEDGSIAIDRVAAVQPGQPPHVFDQAETVGVMTLRGKLTKGSFIFPTPFGNAAVRSMRAKVSRQVSIGPGGRLHIRVHVRYSGLVSQSPDRVVHLTRAALSVVERSCAQALTRRLMLVVHHAQKAGVDAFQFAQAIYLKDPESYRRLGDFGQALRRADIGIRVEVRLPEQGIVV